MGTTQEFITNKIIEALESGEAPWRKPWNASTNGPCNIDGRPYHGMNVFLLLSANRPSRYWLTEKQIDQRGGTIKRNPETGRREHYEPVILWKMTPVKKNGRPVLDDNGRPQQRPFITWFKVWNLSQVDGINEPVSNEPVREFVPLDEAEKVIANYQGGPPILHNGGDRAYYVPASDEIHLPVRESFDTPDEYYSTLFHEMTHSTSHEKRLNRPNANLFGSHPYGREELIAEMGAALLCGETGILPATLDNSAAYLRSWVRTIREDTGAVVWAAGRAQKAVNHILGIVPEKSEDTE